MVKPTMLTQCMVRPCVARRFDNLAVSGLASMYPTFDWSVTLQVIMDISARESSLADRPQVGQLGHQGSGETNFGTTAVKWRLLTQRDMGDIP
jgi:hypothetical protein